MADALPSPDSKGGVDESLKQRLKKQPRRHEMEFDTPKTEGSDPQLDDGVELRGQSMRGDH